MDVALSIPVPVAMMPLAAAGVTVPAVTLPDLQIPVDWFDSEVGVAAKPEGGGEGDSWEPSDWFAALASALQVAPAVGPPQPAAPPPPPAVFGVVVPPAPPEPAALQAPGPEPERPPDAGLVWPLDLPAPAGPAIAARKPPTGAPREPVAPATPPVTLGEQFPSARPRVAVSLPAPAAMFQDLPRSQRHPEDVPAPESEPPVAAPEPVASLSGIIPVVEQRVAESAPVKWATQQAPSEPPRPEAQPVEMRSGPAETTPPRVTAPRPSLLMREIPVAAVALPVFRLEAEWSPGPASPAESSNLDLRPPVAVTLGPSEPASSPVSPSPVASNLRPQPVADAPAQQIDPETTPPPAPVGEPAPASGVEPAPRQQRPMLPDWMEAVDGGGRRMGWIEELQKPPRPALPEKLPRRAASEPAGRARTPIPSAPPALVTGASPKVLPAPEPPELEPPKPPELEPTEQPERRVRGQQYEVKRPETPGLPPVPPPEPVDPEFPVSVRSRLVVAQNSRHPERDSALARPEPPASAPRPEGPAPPPAQVGLESVRPTIEAAAGPRMPAYQPAARLEGLAVRAVEVIERAELRPSPRGAEVQLLLRPENLGRVAVRLIERDGVVEMTVRSDSQPARSLLGESLPSLIEAMNDRGWEISRLERGRGDVFVWSSTHEQGRQQRGGQQQRDQQHQPAGQPEAEFSLELS